MALRSSQTRQFGTVNYLVGNIRPYDPTGETIIPPGINRGGPIINPKHVFWGLDSIRRVSDNRVITYQDTDLEPHGGSTWVPEVFLSTVHVATYGMVFHAPTAGDYTIGLFARDAFRSFGVQVVKVEDQPDVPSFGYGLDLYTRVDGNIHHDIAVPASSRGARQRQPRRHRLVPGQARGVQDLRRQDHQLARHPEVLRCSATRPNS